MKTLALIFFACISGVYAQEAFLDGVTGRPDIHVAVEAERLRQREYLTHHLFASQDDFHQTVAAFNQKIRAMYDADEEARASDQAGFDGSLFKQAEVARAVGDFNAAVVAYEQAVDRAVEALTEHPAGRESTLFLACFRAVETTVTAPRISDATLKTRLLAKGLHGLDVLAERSPGWQTQVVSYRRSRWRQELSSGQ